MGRAVTRRELMATSVAAFAVALTRYPLSAFGLEAGEGEQVIPFVDPQPDTKGKSIQWDQLKEWLTPTPQVFAVSHYGAAQVPVENWKLQLEGLFSKPMSLTLDQIKARPRQEFITTIECSGNGASPTFMGAIANAKWAGTPLAPLLKEAGLSADAVEIAFWGADKGKEKIRNNDVEQNFARTLSIADAMRNDVLLGYELNGEPLSQGHGFPLRLIVPGYYGIAWVKWLTRIEARERRLMNRFTARDYVTLRGKKVGNQTVWTETAVGPMNVKSLVARVVKRKDGAVVVTGAAWGQDAIQRVELKIDDGEWVPVGLKVSQLPHTWNFWEYEWKDAKAGPHTLTSRAIDAKGRVQPAADDPSIKLKKTYWEANQQLPRKIVL